MAVTKVGTAVGTEVVGGTSLTLTVDSAGADCLHTMVGWRNNADQALSSVTWNGSASGVELRGASGASGQRVNIEEYSIVGLDGASHDVVWSFSASADIRGEAQPLSGVSSFGTTGIGTTLGTSDGAVSANAGSATIADDLVMCSFVFGITDITGSLTPNGGQTQTAAPNLVSAECVTAASSEPGGGTVNCGYTWTTSTNDWGRVLVTPYQAARIYPDYNMRPKPMRPAIFSPGHGR